MENKLKDSLFFPFIVLFTMFFTLFLSEVKAQVYVSPGQSINTAISNASSGSTIILRDGRYHQSVTIGKSVTLKAENPGKAIIDGGASQTFSWTKSGSEWSANVSWVPNHIVIGHLSIIRMGTDLRNAGFQGGFYHSNGKVYARLGTDDVNPNNVHVSVQRSSGANTGITVNANNVTVEGLIIQCHSANGIKVNANNFTARDNLIIGSRYGIDMGDQQGNGHLIEYNEVSNYPLFQRSRHTYNMMVNVYHNATDGGIFNSETTSFRFGSLNTIVRYNHCYEHMDGMQPRKMVQSSASARTYIYNNFIWNNRDDGVEFDSNGPQNLRFHNNVVMNGTAVIAPSPVQNGPTIIDHNLILDVPHSDGGVGEKHVMFKFDANDSWTDGYMRNMRIIHNTVVSTNNDGALWWTKPDNGQQNCMVANNIIDIKKELTRSFPLPEANNFRSNSVNFENRTGKWDLRIKSGSGAKNFGSSTHDDFHDYSDGDPDAGAIEFGNVWDFQSVGPRWANSSNMPQRPALPSVIDPEMVGLGQSSDFISLSPASLQFEGEAGSKSVEVTSNISWSASSSASWLSVSPTSGSNNATLTITVNGNATGSVRNGFITVSGSGVSEIISVTQEVACTLPSSWSNGDIGSVSAAGSACESGGIYTVEGSGADIYGTADGFHYVYQSLPGDGEIVARVTSITNTDPWAKAGVMIRDDLTAGSRHGLMHISATSGLQFQTRSSAGGTTVTDGSASGSVPRWIRIVKSGNTLTGYTSTNGSSWTEVGSRSVSMSGGNYIGLAVTSHNDGAINESVFDNVTVNTGSTSTPVNETLSPIADSYVEDNAASTNFGSSTTLLIKGQGGTQWNRESYLKFDLTALNLSEVSSATLRVYGSNIENSSSINIEAFGVGDSWTEVGLTWNNKPTAITSSLSSTAVNDVPSYYEFDITPFVSTEIDGDNIVSIRLSNPSIQYRRVGFNSKENSTNKPELVVEGTSSDPSARKAVSFNESDERFASEGLVSIYPNPTSDILFIELPKGQEGVPMSYHVNDLTGKRILEGIIVKNSGIDISSLSGGTYLLKLFKETDFETHKFLKE